MSGCDNIICSIRFIAEATTLCEPCFNNCCIDGLKVSASSGICLTIRTAAIAARFITHEVCVSMRR